MDKTSAVITGASAAAAGFIAPLVKWLLNAKLGLDAPVEVVSVISVLIVGGAHLACNIFNDRAVKQVQPAKEAP